MTRTRLTLTLLAAAVCGCASKPVAIKSREVGPLSAGTFEVAWSVDASNIGADQIYLAGGYLFVYGNNNVVSCFDTAGGLRFRASVGEPGDVIGHPVVGKDKVIFPTTATLVYYTLTGIKTKTQELPLPVRSPGIMNGDILYVGSDSENGGRLSAIDLNRRYNIYQWSVSTGIINKQPALHDNTVYAATEDGKVFAVNPDRTPLWGAGPETPDGLFHSDGKILAQIKVDDSGVYVASTDTKLYCLALNTGRIRWQYFAGTPLTTSPTVTSDMAYQYVEGQGLVAITKKTAERLVSPKWTCTEGKQVLADDVKYAYVLTDGHGVVAVDKNDGSVAFRSRRSDLTIAVTNTDPKEAAIYALTDDGKLVCIKPVLKSGRVGELAMLTDH